MQMIVLMVDSRDGLQDTVDEFERNCATISLKISVEKNKVLSGQKGSRKEYRESE